MPPLKKGDQNMDVEQDLVAVQKVEQPTVAAPEDDDIEEENDDDASASASNNNDGKSEAKLPYKARPTAPKKRRKHKPKDFPKRPLSAYNIFFRETREVMLREKEKEVGKDNVDFQSMVKDIARKWKSLTGPERERVEGLAKDDLVRYKDQVRAYEEELVKRNRLEREEAARKKREEQKLQAAAAKAAKRKAEQTDRIAAVPPSSMTRERDIGGSLEQGYYRDAMARDPRGGSRNEDHPPSRQMSHQSGLGASEQTANRDELRRVLEDELRQIEAMREVKLNQLAELHAGIIPSRFLSYGATASSSLGGLAASGYGTGGVGGLVGRRFGVGGLDLALEAELELLHREQTQAMSSVTGRGGLFGGVSAPALLGGAGMIPRSHLMTELGLLRGAGRGGYAGTGAAFSNSVPSSYLLGTDAGAAAAGLYGVRQQQQHTDSSPTMTAALARERHLQALEGGDHLLGRRMREEEEAIMQRSLALRQQEEEYYASQYEAALRADHRFQHDHLAALRDGGRDPRHVSSSSTTASAFRAHTGRPGQEARGPDPRTSADGPPTSSASAAEAGRSYYQGDDHRDGPRGSRRNDDDRHPPAATGIATSHRAAHQPQHDALRGVRSRSREGGQDTIHEDSDAENDEEKGAGEDQYGDAADDNTDDEEYRHRGRGTTKTRY